MNGRGLLALYEMVVMLVAAGLTADLLGGGWTEALVTALVVDLGEPSRPARCETGSPAPSETQR